MEEYREIFKYQPIAIQPAEFTAFPPLEEIAKAFVIPPHLQRIRRDRKNWPEVYMVACVSTAHLTDDDRDKLEKWGAPLEEFVRDLTPPLIVFDMAYGWLVVIDDTDTELLEQVGMSEAFRQLYRAAKEDGHRYLHFDCDAPRVDGVEIFEW